MDDAFYSNRGFGAPDSTQVGDGFTPIDQAGEAGVPTPRGAQETTSAIRSLYRVGWVEHTDRILRLEANSFRRSRTTDHAWERRIDDRLDTLAVDDERAAFLPPPADMHENRSALCRYCDKQVLWPDEVPCETCDKKFHKNCLSLHGPMCRARRERNSTSPWSGESDSKPVGDWEQWPAELVAQIARSGEAGTESSHAAAASSSHGAGGQPVDGSGATTYVAIRPAVAETVAIRTDAAEMRRRRTPAVPRAGSGVASVAAMGTRLGRMKITSTAIEPPDGDKGGYSVGPDFPGQYADDEASSARMVGELSRSRQAPSSGGSRSVIECVIRERRCGARREAVWCEECECFYCCGRCAAVCSKCGGEACPFCLCGCRPEDDEADSHTQGRQHMLPSREHRGDGDGGHGGDVSMGGSSTDGYQDAGEDRSDRTGEQALTGSVDEDLA